MTVWIALFRGINVGGNNKLPMKPLSEALTAAGLEAVKTYIASGNVVFRSDLEAPALESLIGDIVARDFGFKPMVFVFSTAHLNRLIAENPFADHEHQGKAQHIFFLKSPARSIDRDFLDGLKAETEAYVLTDRAFYFYAPDGIGRSKLIEKLERGLKADMTARNLNTVLTLRDMVTALEG